MEHAIALTTHARNSLGAAAAWLVAGIAALADREPTASDDHENEGLTSFENLPGFIRTSFRAPAHSLVMNAKRKKLAKRFAVFAVLSLIGGAVVGGLAPGAGTFVALVGFAGYVVNGAKAMKLWPVVLDPTPTLTSTGHGPNPAPRVAAAVVLSLFAAVAMATVIAAS
jgi:hypothetical protein